MSHELDPVIDELKKQGFILTKTSNGHFSAKSKTGTGGIVHFSYSGDIYAFRNTIRDLKKIGFIWPPPDAPKNGAGPSSKAEPCCTLCYNKNGCKDGSCACHLPASAFQPKSAPAAKPTSEELFTELTEARVILQAADEALAHARSKLEEAKDSLAQAEKVRADAVATFAASKKKFDDDMLAGIDLGVSKEGGPS
jgi:hypothetical protein